MKHTQVIHHLRAARVRVEEVQCDGGGRAAVCPLAGRVISLRLPGLDENVFWSSPELHRLRAVGRKMWKLQGGPGGERVWFAPEYAYHWDGKPNLKTYANYTIPFETDPGRYAFGRCTRSAVSLQARPAIRDHRDGSIVTFEVERTIASTASPIPLRGARFVGIRIQHVLRMARAKPPQRVDLWHIVQMPIGSRALVPTTGEARPLVYYNDLHKNGWKCAKDRLIWPYQGDASAKVGLAAAQVTGRAGVLRRLSNGDWAALIWQFPVLGGTAYCDGPSERHARRQQVVQLWDGFGFGELEYHSPSVGIDDPVYAESSLLWCFAGTLMRVNDVAEELMGRRWGVKP